MSGPRSAQKSLKSGTKLFPLPMPAAARSVSGRRTLQYKRPSLTDGLSPSILARFRTSKWNAAQRSERTKAARDTHECTSDSEKWWTFLLLGQHSDRGHTGRTPSVIPPYEPWRSEHCAANASAVSSLLEYFSVVPWQIAIGNEINVVRLLQNRTLPLILCLSGLMDPFHRPSSVRLNTTLKAGRHLHVTLHRRLRNHWRLCRAIQQTSVNVGDYIGFA